VTELIDVLDSAGRFTGVTKTKAEVHRDGDWHRAAHVWIVSGRRVLLQRRAYVKENYPGMWDVSAAGHLSAGETSVEAAVRETFEELGLRINREELQLIGVTRESCLLNDGTYVDHELHDVFIVRRQVELDTLSLDPAEVAEVMWVDGDWPRPLVPHEEEYALLRDRIGACSEPPPSSRS
jgi:isopentenyldiphosphate isomerase